MLSYWARNRLGKKFSLEKMVKALAHNPAIAVGRNDRGLIRPTYRADLNVIDFENLRLHTPEVVYDLPAGGRRLTQHATAYAATIVNGIVTYEAGVPTGALPERLVRGRWPYRVRTVVNRRRALRTCTTERAGSHSMESALLADRDSLNEEY